TTSSEPPQTYPALTSVPDKPVPYNTGAQRQGTVTQLRGEKADVDAQATDLQGQAATMQTLPVPAAPVAATPAAHKPATHRVKPRHPKPATAQTPQVVPEQ